MKLCLERLSKIRSEPPSLSLCTDWLGQSHTPASQHTTSSLTWPLKDCKPNRFQLYSHPNHSLPSDRITLLPPTQLSNSLTTLSLSQPPSLSLLVAVSACWTFMFHRSWVIQFKPSPVFPSCASLRLGHHSITIYVQSTCPPVNPTQTPALPFILTSNLLALKKTLFTSSCDNVGNRLTIFKKRSTRSFHYIFKLWAISTYCTYCMYLLDHKILNYCTSTTCTYCRYP